MMAKGRVIITTFASSVHRVNMILDIADKQGRVVGVVGRSMLNVIAHARNLGYIKCRDDLFQPLQNLRHYRDDQILILTTGSQGESMSALTRMSNSSHRQLEVRQGDTVIFSANPIPGNTIPVVRTIDRVMALGANVIYGKDKGIHVSGHGSQEEHKMMLALVRPKFFFPAHGELRMLRQHAKMAEAMGIPSENIVIAENGDVVEVCQDYMRIVDKVPSGVELVDSSRDGMVKGDVLRDRQQISGEGIFTIAVSVGLDGKLSTNPDIQLSGVVLPMEHSQIIALVAKAIDNSLANSWGNYARNVGSLEIDWIGLRGQLERDLTRVLRQQIQSKPVIVFLLQTPPNSTQSAPAPAAKPNSLGVTLKSGSTKVIPKVDQESSNGNGAAIEVPVATGAATTSVGRRKRTAATV
jgi:ribonuclease J